MLTYIYKEAAAGANALAASVRRHNRLLGTLCARCLRAIPQLTGDRNQSFNRVSTSSALEINFVV